MIKGNIETNIQMLLNKRIKNYQKSHIKINTENLSINDLCNKIIKVSVTILKKLSINTENKS